ncbi:hypothetical protein BDV96DRAFT_48123 [Lophiotrema nucula]|uniref:Uncharacterized protein n=1 Tax=Lophiotrema nucula TaxID=690887 RepID=A0A6A5ZA45_9PLEO|nr:hypothetical protein BDV96DRAFT_48123 [Lophiotrema nucula]
MARNALVVGALVALAQSKAIVTNHCPKAVHLWSVPESNGYASHHKLEPFHKYEEFYHHGTKVNPGVAIKISTHPNGIYEAKDEIDFAYTVDNSDSNKVWVSLDNLRSKSFDSVHAFFTCWGPYKAPYVPTRECVLRDNIELVLCGTNRTEAAKDDSPKSLIHKCTTSLDDRNYDEHHMCNGIITSPLPQPSKVRLTVLKPDSLTEPAAFL